MRRDWLTIICVGLAAMQLAGAAADSDWPGWRNSRRDGKSNDQELLRSWPAEGPKLLWKASGIGQGYSGVTVVGETLYTSGIEGGKLYLIALDTDGAQKWKLAMDDGHARSYAGSRSSPTWADGLIYLESDLGKVGCYDAATGAEKWTRHLREFGGKMPQWGFAESVLISGDLAIVTPGGTNCLVALDRRSGATRWASEAFAAAQYSSPIQVNLQGISMIVNGTRGGLIAVDASNGRRLWTNDFAANNTANCPTPAYEDGYLFWANGYRKGGICLELAVKEGAVTATEAWRTADMDCHHGGYVIHDGHIYGNHRNGWVCLELKSGRKLWQEQGVGKGSLCFADGMLFLFGEKNGQVACAPASPEGLQLAGSFSVQGKGPSWAHPVVTGGRLYLRYGDNIYAYAVKQP